MQDLYSETIELLKKYRITANKNLGQNFLISEEVVQKILESAQITKEDVVIEIGPGLGTLTKYLLEKAGKVICIELDHKMVQILQDRLSQEKNIEIIHQDILKVDLKQKIKEEKQIFKTVKVVANLPYYITTPIIMKLLEEKLDLEMITVMCQKEVADRLIAIPGNSLSGAITYTVYYYAEGKSVVNVPNSAFIPSPEINSEVIQLKIRKEPAVKVENEQNLFRVIKASFMQRRKTLLNGLTNSNLFENKEKVIKILETLDIDKNIRAEKLTLEQFSEISKHIKQN